MITSINSYKVNKFIITADYVCTDFSSNLFLLTKNHQPQNKQLHKNIFTYGVIFPIQIAVTQNQQYRAFPLDPKFYHILAKLKAFSFFQKQTLKIIKKLMQIIQTIIKIQQLRSQILSVLDIDNIWLQGNDPKLIWCPRKPNIQYDQKKITQKFGLITFYLLTGQQYSSINDFNIIRDQQIQCLIYSMIFNQKQQLSFQFIKQLLDQTILKKIKKKTQAFKQSVQSSKIGSIKLAYIDNIKQISPNKIIPTAHRTQRHSILHTPLYRYFENAKKQQQSAQKRYHSIEKDSIQFSFVKKQLQNVKNQLEQIRKTHVIQRIRRNQVNKGTTQVKQSFLRRPSAFEVTQFSDFKTKRYPKLNELTKLDISRTINLSQIKKQQNIQNKINQIATLSPEITNKKQQFLKTLTNQKKNVEKINQQKQKSVKFKIQTTVPIIQKSKVKQQNLKDQKSKLQNIQKSKQQKIINEEKLNTPLIKKNTYQINSPLIVRQSFTAGQNRVIKPVSINNKQTKTETSSLWSILRSKGIKNTKNNNKQDSVNNIQQAQKKVKQQVKQLKEEVNSNQSVASRSMEIQMIVNMKKQSINFINLLGESVSNAFKTTKKLNIANLDKIIASYLIYKRFWFQRKKIEQYLIKKQNKAFRKGQKILKMNVFQEWINSEKYNSLTNTIIKQNEQIQKQLKKMFENISKREYNEQVSKYLPIQNRDIKKNSQLLIRYILQEYKIISQNELNDEIRMHLAKFLDSLFIVCEIDEKYSYKVDLLKRKNIKTNVQAYLTNLQNHLLQFKKKFKIKN